MRHPPEEQIVTLVTARPSLGIRYRCIMESSFTGRTFLILESMIADPAIDMRHRIGDLEFSLDEESNQRT
jgi:hypothetical protein